MYSFLHKALAEQSLAKTLAKRPTETVDGGRRVVKNIIYRAQLGVMHLKSMRGLPRWMAPTVSAVALAIAVVMQRRIK